MSQTVQQLVDAARARIREIRPGELASLLHAAPVPIIDVREPEEFEDGHLPGAVNIPRGLLEFEVDGHPAVAYHREEALSHREQPLLLYCLSGARSALAAEALRRLGFASPMSLEGGFLAWADAGHPVVSLSGEWQSNSGTPPAPLALTG
ncbi:MAG TPA: rhodanese-like domain-containing protein [Steroidobacteraceae bacterium]|nr:rhodanese-like domain-containing protein [Steroidobacteraceae bacterium]